MKKLPIITAPTLLLVLLAALSLTAASDRTVEPTAKKIRFTDVTFIAKIPGDNLAGGHGIGWADIDGDGDLDFFVANTPSHSFFRNYLYVNKGDGTFMEVAKKRGVAGEDDGSHAGVFADIDNDGDYDLLVSNSGLDLGPGQNRVYQNDGKGFFTDITEKAGLIGDLFRTRGIAAADFNNDGWIDFVVCNALADTDTIPAEPLPIARFYLNTKKGSFVKRINGLTHTGFTNGVTTGDVDNDGDIDLLESKRGNFNYSGMTHQLWLNNGKGSFTDGNGHLGPNFSHDPEGIDGNGTVLGDLDNDGDLDLLTISSQNVRVWRNEGSGNFVEVTAESGITGDAYSAAIGDLDNDGDQDIVIANLRSAYVVWENLGGMRFKPHEDAGVSPPAFNDPRGIALADYDDDGDLDLSLVHKFNHAQLFRNDNNTQNFIKIRLNAPNGQAGGIGAKVWVYKAGSMANLMGLLAYREVTANTAYLAQNAPEVHVGLAKRKPKVDIRILYLDGTESRFYSIKPGTRLKVEFN